MTVINGYEQSDREQKLTILNLPSLEAAAKKIIPSGGFGYISGGSEDEWTLKQNTMAFNHVQIVPRALTDMEQPSTQTQAFGIDLKTPIMMAPAAAQGLAHARGEAATAEGMAQVGALMAQSTYSSTSIADTAAAGKGAPQFFQLYMSKDWNFNQSLLDEAVKAGAKAIILTVDATVDGYREADIINNFQFPIPMANLTKFSEGDGKGKGIIEIYAAAAQKISPADVRRGSHVFKALANGADLVALARPIIYGLALGGAQGVASVVSHLNDELLIDMQLAGTKTIEDVKRAKLLR
ncbi:alpha-hydroxy-acid oxidizing protein [Lactiplantibacillus plantarum]|uniref:alpha-hydroxy-acid oxidizing protein n=1 Tax=Lactiplantibacillus plantarum TaxID=1590 RepID=UPI001D06A9EB|nr:alpha-hydroxy-acid oxidizing protein [Lactiplantibacillus plantarum]MCB7140409.1 alpha-hydroxy-acid oxidizing protein [Lactiplantibacillus plantarum]MCB7156437.1 alpha-hydroxy-acid oxidizing protein [Lactiplantibacillus plantarum]MCB7165973.1 alpha-hydroxy-acid oxidizing protein [Lactiplantibacillus plantarum]MCB7167713.1 alpha-hydroxy-acid oxidizing protein [Lactiplantibacillus plantarum]MCB7174080.1 alpha-hydroxy-acid oxidizing protein [Lactiplantibacillus plantarum]